MCVCSVLSSEIDVDIEAPLEKGKANGAVEMLLAEELGLPKSAIVVTAGKSAQKKIVEIQGLPMTEVIVKLT
tara:strand:- start:43842 stop:44057 length:216 start_codon:yes stop_codon:yes gene_type:complete